MFELSVGGGENILELVVWGPDVLSIVGMRKVDLRAEIGFHAFLLWAGLGFQAGQGGGQGLHEGRDGLQVDWWGGRWEMFKASNLGMEDSFLKLSVEHISWILLETGED